MDTKSKTEIVIVDDHPIFCHGLRQIIEADPSFKVIGEAGDGETAIRLIEQSKPAIAILDIDIPKSDGFELAEMLRDKRLATKIIFLTLHAEEEFINQALDLGVSAYVLKESAVTEIVACLRAVMA